MKPCISVPTSGSIHAETAGWCLRMFARFAPDIIVDFVVDPRPLVHMRNLQVVRFLATDATHLFLLDSDCVPREDTLERLLAYNLPFVTAPGPIMVNGEVGLMVVDKTEDGQYKQHLPLEGMQRADAVGCAGMLIRRDVLEKIEPPWFYMEYDAQGLLSLGEDMWFCRKLASYGYEVWADCELAQKHMKQVVL